MMINDNINGEISLSKIYDKYSRLLKLIIISRRLILLFIVVGFLSGFIYSLFTQDLYVAEYKFLIKEDRPKSLNNVFASSLGFDLKPIEDLSIYQTNTFSDLFESRNVIEKSLLKTVEINNELITFADLYCKLSIQKNDLKKYKNRFPVESKRHSFSRDQDSILNLIYSDIVVNRLSVGRDKKNENIFVAELNSRSEFFSIKFLSVIFDVILDDYMSMKSRNIKLIEVRVVDLKSEINELLKNKHLSQNSISRFNYDFLKSSEYDLEIDLKVKMLSELTTQLEISKLNFANNYQFIQIIDSPNNPLPVKKTSRVTFIFLGGFLFGILAILLIFLKINLERVFNFG